MARPNLNLKIDIENIHCFDQSDNWLGSSEPYLWAAFFKIDGDSYAFEPNGVGLIGSPTIFSTNGSHGNLPNDDVDPGENVPVPESIGLWSNTLKPIPMNDPVLKAFVDDLPGICGVAVVLMEQDDWPDNLADTGYTAFVNALNLSVLKIGQSFQHALAAPTQAQIDAAVQQIKNDAATMVHDAVEGAMSGIQTLWFGTVGNNDDELGSQVWTWNSDDFTNNVSQDFSARWKDGGNDWEIQGTTIGVVPCPADALDGLFGGPQGAASGTAGTAGAAGAGAGTGGEGGPGGRGASSEMRAMRLFRDKEFRKYPGLSRWWTLLSLGNTHFIHALIKDPKSKESVNRLFHGIVDILQNPDKTIAAKHWEDLEFVLVSVSKKSRILKRTLTNRALNILPELKGKTFNEAISHLSDLTQTVKKTNAKKEKKK